MTREEMAPDGRAGCAWGLLAILVLAFALRFWGLQGQSLFCDEVVEASIARLEWRQIIAYPDGFPPLYHLALAAWSRVFPEPESGRWLSVLLGVVAVYAVARWARRMAGPATGMVAGVLMAISPLHVYLSQEMRAYSLYLCLASFALMYFFESLQSGLTRSWILFAVVMSLAVNTHYYAVLLAGLLLLVLIYYRRGWKELRPGLTAYLLLAIGSLPAVALLPGDMSYQTEGFAGPAPLLATLGHTAFAIFGGYSAGPSLTELHVASMREAAAMAAPWATLFGAIGLWLACQGWVDLRRRPFGGAVVFLALVSAPAIGLAGELAGVGPKVRYWSWILMPVIVWLAVGTTRSWQGRMRWLTGVALATLVAVQVIAVVNRHVDPRYANEDVRAVAEYLKANASVDAPVFVVADYMAPPVRYYLNGRATLHGWLPYVEHASRTHSDASVTSTADAWTIFPRSEDDVRGSTPFDDAAIEAWLAAVRELAGDDGRFWLVYSREYHGDPGGLLLKRLQQLDAVELERQFPGVRLYRGALPERLR